jgi:phosphoglycolate phosphatase
MAISLFLDFDGTLIDSAPGIVESLGHTLAAHGLAARSPLAPSLIGPPLLDTLQAISGIDDAAALAEMAATFKTDYDHHGYRMTRPYPGVAASLKRLRQRGFRLFLVTNKRTVPTRRIVEFLRWNDYFDAVDSLDSLADAAARKSDLVAAIMSRERVSADAAALVGDTREDAIAARSNCLHFFAAGWGYGSLAAGEDATTYLARPDELATIDDLGDPVAAVRHRAGANVAAAR